MIAFVKIDSSKDEDLTGKTFGVSEDMELIPINNEEFQRHYDGPTCITYCGHPDTSLTIVEYNDNFELASKIKKLIIDNTQL